MLHELGKEMQISGKLGYNAAHQRAVLTFVTLKWVKAHLLYEL